MFESFLTSGGLFRILEIREYLHFDLRGPRDYFLVYETLSSFLTRISTAETYERIVLNLLRLVPALPLVVQNSFPNVIPQSVTIERDNVLKQLNMTRDVIGYSSQGLDLYMSALTMERYKSTQANNYSREYDTSSNYLPYLQSNISELRENEISRLFRKLTKIDPETFYNELFNEEKKETKFLQGERLYALADHLMFFKDIEKAFDMSENNELEKACEMFLEDTNSTLDFGSLLIYFHVLKGYMKIEQKKRMEEKLIKRRDAERMFVNYFFYPNYERGSNISEISEDFQYVFFLAFAKVFLFYTQTERRATEMFDQREEQQRCLNLLVDTLESIPTLKELLNHQRITPELYFHEFLLKKLTTSTKSVPLDQLKRICSKDWGNVLAGASQVGFKSYEKSSLTIIRLLSEGAQGDVELVKVPGLSVPVVAKFFFLGSSGLVPDEAFKQMKEEIRSLLSTQCHPHIVSLYGYIVKNHQIVGTLMELCKGGSLRSVINDLKTQSYTESSIIIWSLHASSGLLFIHENNIIHRDVKPENMLLNEEHKLLKIGDLGTTKLCKIASTVLHSNYTKERGTAGYQAPEILEKRGYSSKVDVFALGRSIWSMIIRRDPPVNGPLDKKLDRKVLVSSEIWKFSERMMAHDPDSRPTMAEVYTFFEGQLNRLPTQSDPAGNITTQPASRLIFNAPFDDKLTCPLKITNTTVNNIGWTIKPFNMEHLSADPSYGYLGPREAAVVTISCGPFVYGQRGNDDCIVIKWTKVSDGNAKDFCHEWFQDDGVVRNKKLSIEYNP